MIKIRSLSKVYHKGGASVKALDDINLDIDKGDIYGIVGLSGAGKSSLVRCINRLESATAGTVHVGELNISTLKGKSLRRARQNIGMIFQNFSLLSSKTVYENVAFPLRLQKQNPKQIHERVMTLLEKVELTDKAHVFPAQLSGGQKQRVGIARALAPNPDVLLCDEATSALDPKTTKQILELLKRLNQELGVTLIVITHEMDVVKAICNKVAILESGQIIANGDTLDVFTGRTNAQTRHFIGELEVPSSVSKHGKRLSLIFANGSAKFPILSQIIKHHQVDINILSGTIENIQDVPIGRLIIEITPPLIHEVTSFEGDFEAQIAHILELFKDNAVIAEVIS